LTPSTDPNVLGLIDEQVVSIAVDDTRVYWLGIRAIEQNHIETALRSCNKTHCVDSLVTYGENVAEIGFGVEDNQVFWFDAPEPGRNDLVLRSCNAAGCAGKPGIVLQADWVNMLSATFSQGSVYLCSGSNSVSPLTWQRIPLYGDPHSILANAERGCGAGAVQGDYFYWLAVGAEPPLSRIQRIRTDGSAAAETIADRLDVMQSTRVGYYDNVFYHPHGLAFDSNYVYWAQGSLHGSLARCPLRGCDGDPELVLDPVRSPTNVLLDQSKLYWLHDTSNLGYALSSCALGNCEASTLALGVDSRDAVAVDDVYVYTATTTHRVDEGAGGFTKISAQIQRVAK